MELVLIALVTLPGYIAGHKIACAFRALGFNL